MSDIILQKLTKQNINRNPFKLSGILYSLIDNGYGEMIEDRAAPVVKNYVNPVRIFRKKKLIKSTMDNSTPYVYEDVYYLLSDYETEVDVRLEFEYNFIKFKIKTKEKLIKYEKIIGFQYELDEITEANIA